MAHLACFLHSLWLLLMTLRPKAAISDDLALGIKSTHLLLSGAHLGLYPGQVFAMHLLGDHGSRSLRHPCRLR